MPEMAKLSHRVNNYKEYCLKQGNSDAKDSISMEIYLQVASVSS